MFVLCKSFQVRSHLKRNDYENPEEFFSYDPIGITSGPRKGERTFEDLRNSKRKVVN